MSFVWPLDLSFSIEACAYNGCYVCALTGKPYILESVVAMGRSRYYADSMYCLCVPHLIECPDL